VREIEEKNILIGNKREKEDIQIDGKTKKKDI
jgi:hypothetical protein